MYKFKNKLYWKRQNLGDSEGISGYKGLEARGRMNRWNMQSLGANETALYDATVMDTCN